MSYFPRTLVVVTSFERPAALSNCLKSLRDVGGLFDVIVVDEKSKQVEVSAAAA